jgi:hypothetical protein
METPDLRLMRGQVYLCPVGIPAYFKMYITVGAGKGSSTAGVQAKLALLLQFAVFNNQRYSLMPERKQDIGNRRNWIFRFIAQRIPTDPYRFPVCRCCYLFI